METGCPLAGTEETICHQGRCEKGIEMLWAPDEASVVGRNRGLAVRAADCKASNRTHLDSPRPKRSWRRVGDELGVSHLLGTALYLDAGHLFWCCPKSTQVESNIILILQQRKLKLWATLVAQQVGSKYRLRLICPKAQIVRSQSSACPITNIIPKSP